MIHKNRTNNLILDGEILQMCVALILVTICEWTNVKSIAELVKFNNWSIGGFCRINHSECNLFWLFYSRLYMCVRVEVECGKSHFQHKKFPHFHFFISCQFLSKLQRVRSLSGILNILAVRCKKWVCFTVRFFCK